MDIILIVFIAVTAVMVSASVWDVRSREVSDAHWMAIGVMGMAVALMSDDLLAGAVTAAGYLMFMLYMFVERVKGTLALLVISAGMAMLLMAALESEEVYPMVTLVMTMIFLLMYATGAMKGGADVKALVVLSFVFPAYPEFGSLVWEPVYPQGYIFNPMFSILLIALVISVVYAIIVNHHRSGGKRIASYVTTKAEAESSFVWVLEKMDDENVRVTPMIPFLVPMTVGLLITVILGCPLFALI